MKERNVVSIELDAGQYEILLNVFGPLLATRKKAAIIGQPNNDLTAVRFTLLEPDEVRAVFAALNPGEEVPA